MFKLSVQHSVRLCRRFVLAQTQCLCTKPPDGSTTQHEDRTKLEGDKYDDTPEYEARQSEYRQRQQEEEETDAIKQRILGAALRYVPEHGWSKQAIVAGTQEAGYPATTHGLISHGPVELVYHFYSVANQDLANKLAKDIAEYEQGTQIKPGTTDFIKQAVIYRLQLVVPYMDTWPQALGLMSLPQNTFTSLKHLHQLVDDVWYYAGDRSADFNYYTKRGSLAAVYKATSLHMLQDKSADYTETWAFLERRLRDLGTVGKGVKQIQNLAGSTGNLLLGGCMVATNILGLRSRQS